MIDEMLIRRPTVTRQSDQWMDLNSPPLTDPSRFEIHQFATAGRASTSATPSARHAGQARRVSPDLARHGSGCPVLGSLVPSGPDTPHPASSPDWLCSASLPRKSKHGHTWPPPRARGVAPAMMSLSMVLTYSTALVTQYS